MYCCLIDAVSYSKSYIDEDSVKDFMMPLQVFDLSKH